MKLECTKEQLLYGVSIAEKISGRHPTLPILNCLLLDAQEGILKIKATNLELGIEITVSSKISSPGVVAVPAATLFNTLNNTRDTTLILELQNDNLVIQTPTSKTIIKVVPADDFPTLPHISVEPFSIKNSDIMRGLKAVWYSASTATIKPELSSVYIYAEGNSLVFVATDSFRLAEKIIPTKQTYTFKPILLPLRAIPELMRALERSEENVAVSVSEHQISFTLDTIYFTSRIVDAMYPDYRQIIPKEKTSEVIVLKHDIFSVLKKTAVFSGKFNQVHIEVDPKKKQCIVSAKSEIGETSDALAAALTGDEVAINFNLKYLTDCFQAIMGDSVSLSFSGSGKPLVIRDVSDASYLYLVMPMNR